MKNQFFWGGKVQNPTQCKDLKMTVKTPCGTPSNPIHCENAPTGIRNFGWHAAARPFQLRPDPGMNTIRRRPLCKLAKSSHLGLCSNSWFPPPVLCMFKQWVVCCPIFQTILNQFQNRSRNRNGRFSRPFLSQRFCGENR